MWKSWDGKINQNSFITVPELITLCCLISFRHPSSQSTNSMSKFWTNQEISFWQQFWFLRQLEIWFPRFGVVHFWNPPGRAPLLLPALCPISWRARGKPMGKPGKLKKLPNITFPLFLVQCSMRKRIFSLCHRRRTTIRQGINLPSRDCHYRLERSLIQVDFSANQKDVLFI